MSILVVMVGVPGAGKSTVTDVLARNYGFDIVCPDDIREELYGDASVQGNGFRVLNIAYDRMVDSLSSNENGVIFDATNCRRKARRQVLEAAAGLYDYSVCVIVDENLSTCLNRNVQRSRQVPEEVIEKMFDNLHSCWPDVNEGFDDVVSADKIYELLDAIIESG